MMKVMARKGVILLCDWLLPEGPMLAGFMIAFAEVPGPKEFSAAVLLPQVALAGDVALPLLPTAT
jgi:hypothetical protein